MVETGILACLAGRQHGLFGLAANGQAGMPVPTRPSMEVLYQHQVAANHRLIACVLKPPCKNWGGDFDIPVEFTW